MKKKDGLLSGLLAALYPQRCLGCDDVVGPGTAFCRRCMGALPVLPPAELPLKNQCRPMAWTVAPFWYRGGVKRAIHRMKFNKRTDAADFFAPHMVGTVRRCIGEDYRPDWVVPVPMSPGRLAERGYNQAALLAEPVCGALGGEYRPEILERRGSVVQHELSARLRRLEAESSYGLGQGSPAGKRILLVDDVCTTGSTLRRCAWLLLDAGAAEVACVTAAATPLEEHGRKNMAIL